MKRIRLLGLALIAVFALGALASASAFAELPEIKPEPTAAKPQPFTASGGEAKLIGTKEKSEVVCKKFSASGSFTTPQAGTGDITFSECEAKKAKCKSPGAAEGTILTEGEVKLLDVLPTGVLDLGLYVRPGEDGATTKMLTFKCGLVEFVILGAAIGVFDNKKGELLLGNSEHPISLAAEEEIKLLYKLSATTKMQEIMTCMSPVALCGAKEENKFQLEVEFGEGHELATEVVDAGFKFEKAVELLF